METFERTEWYVVFTACRAENGVKRRLAEAGVECEFPGRVHPCEWRGRVMEARLPSLAGCLFVKVAPSRLAEVSSVRDVVACWGREGRPSPVTEEQKRLFCRIVEESGDAAAAFGALG